MTEPLNSGPISTRIQRLAKQAEEHRERSFRSINHAIDKEWLREALRLTRKNGATGVDGEDWSAYQVGLEARLDDLLMRFKTGLYRAPPVKRVHIPKGDGRTRPIGIPTLEDKVLQRAVTMLMEAIYEQDFLPCSYGFRPGRSAHDAIEALYEGVSSMGGGWIVDLDIRDFFGTLNHEHLKSFLDRRVSDGVMRRVTHKWLTAGVMEDGRLWHPETGTPQGGVISPLLANVYLHEVLDTWFARDVQPRLKGRSFMVRYADDAVLVFAKEDEARRVLDVLTKRLARFGLELNADKTRLVRFERPVKAAGDDDDSGPGSESFDFLGFTHYWGKSRKDRWVVRRKTAKSRLARALQRVTQWCRLHRHDRVAEQAAQLRSRMRGHYNYYGVTGNMRSITAYSRRIERVWRFWLSRRSQRAITTWMRFRALLKAHPLPAPRLPRSIYQR
jgi:RNA-directed DNA polymerase